MSRIGKMPVPVPDTVKVTINGRTVAVEGPKGKLQLDLPELTDAKLEESQVVVTRESEVKRARAMHGLARALINNMVVGVEKGFVKKLEIHGVGFKAALQGKVLAGAACAGPSPYRRRSHRRRGPGSRLTYRAAPR